MPTPEELSPRTEVDPHASTDARLANLSHLTPERRDAALKVLGYTHLHGGEDQYHFQVGAKNYYYFPNLNSTAQVEGSRVTAVNPATDPELNAKVQKLLGFIRAPGAPSGSAAPAAPERRGAPLSVGEGDLKQYPFNVAGREYRYLPKGEMVMRIEGGAGTIVDRADPANRDVDAEAKRIAAAAGIVVPARPVEPTRPAVPTAPSGPTAPTAPSAPTAPAVPERTSAPVSVGEGDLKQYPFTIAGREYRYFPRGDMVVQVDGSRVTLVDRYAPENRQVAAKVREISTAAGLTLPDRPSESGSYTRASILTQLTGETREAVRAFPQVRFAPDAAVRVPRDIADARLPNYSTAMKSALNNMLAALRSVTPAPAGDLTFNGKEYSFKDAAGNLTVTNSVYTFTQSARETNKKKFETTDREGRPVTALRDTSDGRSSRYDMFLFERTVDGRTQQQYDMFRADGTLAIREIKDSTGVITHYVYNGDGPDVGKNARPALIRNYREGVQVGVGTERHTVSKGMYFVPETGQPVAPFVKTGNAADDKRRATEFLNNAAARLRTPEQITAFVSSYIDFTSNGDYYSKDNLVIRGKGDEGGDYTQTAEESIIRGMGDCEDFAVLICELCKKAGVNCMVLRITSNHQAACFIDEQTDTDGKKTYDMVTMHTGGFERKTGFATQMDAMKSLYKDGSGEGEGPVWRHQVPKKDRDGRDVPGEQEYVDHIVPFRGMTPPFLNSITRRGR